MYDEDLMGDWYRHQGRGMIGDRYNVYRVDEVYVYVTHHSLSGRLLHSKNKKASFVKYFAREKPRGVQQPPKKSQYRVGAVQNVTIPWKLR